MTGLTDHIVKNAAEYTAILGLLAVAVVINMPHPDQVADLLGASKGGRWVALGYKWVYDSMQSFMSARNPNQHTSTISTSVQTPTTSSHTEATVVNPTQAPLGPKE